MSIFTIIGGISGIIVIAGGVTAYFRRSVGDSLIAYQAKEIEVRDGTIARLEKENAAITAEKNRLKKENATLERLAQGSPQLANLTLAVQNNTEAINNLIKAGGVK